VRSNQIVFQVEKIRFKADGRRRRLLKKIKIGENKTDFVDTRYEPATCNTTANTHNQPYLK